MCSRIAKGVERAREKLGSAGLLAAVPIRPVKLCRRTHKGLREQLGAMLVDTTAFPRDVLQSSIRCEKSIVRGVTERDREIDEAWIDDREWNDERELLP